MTDEERKQYQEMMHKVGEKYEFPRQEKSTSPWLGKCTKTALIESDDGDVGELVTFFFDDVGGCEYYFPLSESHEYMQDYTGIPHEYKGRTTADFNWNIYGKDMTFEKKFVNTYIKRWELARAGGDGMYIYSKTPGSGKTLLACSIGTEITRKYGIRMRFMTTTKYLDLCKTRGAEYEDLFTSDLLVLDDIGAEDESKAYVAEMIYNLVNRRYSQKLPTIYTSNKLVTDDGYEPRIASRLEINTQIAMPERSIRREMAQKHQAAFIKQLMGGNEQ